MGYQSFCAFESPWEAWLLPTASSLLQPWAALQSRSRRLPSRQGEETRLTSQAGVGRGAAALSCEG